MTTTPERTATLTALVAAEIRAQMGRLNVRQSELARRMGENDTWVHTRLKGPTPIDLNDLVRFARALGVGVYELMPSAETADGATVGPTVKPLRRRGREEGSGSTVNVNYQDRHHRATEHVARVTPHRPITGGRQDSTRPGGPLGERHRRPVSTRPANRPAAA